MLDQEEFIQVGYIRKGHGYKGHARVVVADEWKEDFMQQEFIFLEIDGYKVPFYVQERQDTKDIIIKLEHIDSVEAMQAYHKNSLYVLKKDIKHAQEIIDEQEKTSAIIGMHIHDKSLGDIGAVIRVDEYPQQEMAIIMSADASEILIPMHPSLITDIDETSQIIHMDLPEGLVNL